MALRVLLADESATIKKVMQLSLQDFDVEVKSVAVGVDVIPVAKAFEPHIVFADVLLAKKSGYEVCADIKNDPQLKNTPCILMWSGFMELDEVKAKACKANKRLEKPFDPETLRALVRELVPEMNDNLIANYLSFPDMPDFVEPAKPPQTPQAAPPAPKPTAPPVRIASEPAEIEEIEEFQQVPLAKNNAQIKPPGKSKETDSWSHQDLTRFKLNLPTDEITPDYDDSSLMDAQIAVSGSNDEVSFDELDNPPSAKPKTSQASAALDVHQLEEIVRAQVREVLQDIAWKVLPDMAERIIREEIQKLMKESEKLS